MRYRKTLLAGASGLAMLGYTGVAQAVTVATGQAWINQTAAANNALVANKPVSAANVTFTIPSNPLLMCAPGPGLACGTTYTLGGFLNSGGALGAVYSGGASAGSSLNNTYWFFSGFVTVTHNETFTFAHDDGLELIVNGLDVIKQPAATSPITQTGTYTGAAGNFAYSLAYGECCGPPAELDVNLPFTAATPLPATLPLLSGGLGLLGWMGMRRKRKVGAVAA